MSKLNSHGFNLCPQQTNYCRIEFVSFADPPDLLRVVCDIKTKLETLARSFKLFPHIKLNSMSESLVLWSETKLKTAVAVPLALKGLRG